ncbi:MAG: shikimate dehydrogenase [Microscillaceae bacterium]|nr:shikimate dehydrogenase [Microscillaceae bacterium]
MQKYGLIGYPLSHSFSKQFFEAKFAREQLQEASYELYELKSLQELPPLLAREPGLLGLNVTIPYKQKILPYLKNLSPSAQTVGAVNVIKINADKSLTGHNTDYYGFLQSLSHQLGEYKNLRSLDGYRALVLGTGGASQAVQAALQSLKIPFQLVSRTKKQPKNLLYENLSEALIAEHRLIINTTPLGMYPQTDTCPPIPYQFLNAQHLLYDLVYNPEMTLFLQKGNEAGARIKGGLEMLHLQAEKAWEIWQSPEISTK